MAGQVDDLVGAPREGDDLATVVAHDEGDLRQFHLGWASWIREDTVAQRRPTLAAEAEDVLRVGDAALEVDPLFQAQLRLFSPVSLSGTGVRVRETVVVILLPYYTIIGYFGADEHIICDIILAFPLKDSAYIDYIPRCF